MTERRPGSYIGNRPPVEREPDKLPPGTLCYVLGCPRSAVTHDGYCRTHEGIVRPLRRRERTDA